MTAALMARTWSVLVPHHASGARLARHKLAKTLADRIRPGFLADVMTVVAELVGNAVRHARPLPDGMIRITCQLIAGRGRDSSMVRIRVTDGGSNDSPQLRSATPESLSGRGLAMVAALAKRWGVEVLGTGRCVWAELCGPGTGR